MRSHPLSVAEAAAKLKTSEAYVRRLLASRRIFGIKVGPVWGIYDEDLESFLRMRRPPGRPRKIRASPLEEKDTRVRIDRDRASTRTGSSLRRPRQRN